MRQTSLSVERAQRIAVFRAALRAFESRTERVVRDCGLTPQRYLLLLMVKGAPDGSERMRLTELADRLKASPNSVTELVDRAADAGLVTRDVEPGDARVVLVALTEEGEERLARAVDENDRHRRELADAFSVLARTFAGAAGG